MADKEKQNGEEPDEDELKREEEERVSWGSSWGTQLDVPVTRSVQQSSSRLKRRPKLLLKLRTGNRTCTPMS